MDMPKPGSEHKRLEAMVGSWFGEEQLHPSPWDPKGGPATGRIEARLALDGFFVTSDYEEERGGEITYRGHGVYGWDAQAKAYTMYWFDSMGMGPAGPAKGTWSGNTLTFEQSSPMGNSRYVYEFQRDGVYRFRIDMGAGGDWKTWMEATYTRG